MTTITRIEQTCVACPSQWDMWDDNNLYYYVRYRWGELSVICNNVETVYRKQIGDNLDGTMSTEDMKRHLHKIFDFTEEIA